MSQAGSKKGVKGFMPDLDRDTKITLAILGAIAGGLFFLITLIGLGGQLGAVVRNLCLLLFGYVAYAIPFVFFIASGVLIHLQKHTELKEDVNMRFYWGFIFMIIAVEGFLSLFLDIRSWSSSDHGGGVLGYIIYPIILSWVGPVIAGVILLLFLSSGFFLVTNLTFVQFMSLFSGGVREPSKFGELIPDALKFWRLNPHSQNFNSSEGLENKKIPLEPLVNSANSVANDSKTKVKTKPVFTFDAADNGVIEFKKSNSITSNFKSMQSTGWGLPLFSILKESKGVADPGDIEGNKETIRNTLDQFGIKVEMDSVIIGPTVTQYTLRPANGVRLSAIDNLQRDLALALATPNIRIMPIPGKTLVGIEVPNTVMSEVRLREMFETREFIESENLTVAIGKDVAGKNLFYPITKMPHLLVAGATGSGKSVWINSLLLSLLFKYSPVQLELILVDMKRVELKLYDGIPHLLTSVITDAEKAINALKWTVLEMDRRYQLLEEHGKRNITDFNIFAKTTTDVRELPFEVFVIDELADLMMMAKAEVEPIIARLTQMSRAVGIHLVLGTQRPDTTVITGLIKANVPTRIAFAVASQIDSRVILDAGGADKLLGKGDGMILSPSSLTPIRFQGANVDESEVRETVNFLKSQLLNSQIPSNNNEAVIETPKQKIKIPGLDQTGGGEDGKDVDDIYEEAKRIVIQYQKASASFLQQTMGIGYPKAARIVMELEERGVVGPANGSKPRDVYLTSDSLS